MKLKEKNTIIKNNITEFYKKCQKINKQQIRKYDKG